MRRLAMLASTILLCSATAALAKDRPVTEQEKTKLVEALKAEGCTGGGLEFDDNRFEVDDAVCADGKKYDLHFDQSFKMTKKELDT